MGQIFVEGTGFLFSYDHVTIHERTNINMWLTEEWIKDSPTIESVRSEVQRYQLNEQKYDGLLSELAFGSHGKIGTHIIYSIEKTERLSLEGTTGIIRLGCGGPKNVKDSLIATYLIVKIGTAIIFEGIRTFNNPNNFQLFHNGILIGILTETTSTEVEQPNGFWKRLFFKKRKWKILVGDTSIGELKLQYPLNVKTQLFIKLYNGLSLPISVCRRTNMVNGGGIPAVPFRENAISLLYRKPLIIVSGDMIIPLNTHNYIDSRYDSTIEYIHFLMNVLFRTYYHTLDFN
jgi:hypothetical protein